MNAIDIEKLNQLISRTDISGNDKVRWLEDFISGRELQQQERSYSEEDMLEFMQFIVSEEELENTSGVSIDTAKYFLNKFKNK